MLFRPRGFSRRMLSSRSTTCFFAILCSPLTKDGENTGIRCAWSYRPPVLTSFIRDELDCFERRELSRARRIARSLVCSCRARLSISANDALSSCALEGPSVEC